MDPKVGWASLDISTINYAIVKIEDECRREALRLGDSANLTELINWKLWQVHRLAQKKAGRDGKLVSNGIYIKVSLLMTGTLIFSYQILDPPMVAITRRRKIQKHRRS